MKVNPIQFFRQVRQEVKKVTWPTRKEALQVSFVVILIVAIAAVFFFFVDIALAWLVRVILGMGG